MKLIYIRLKIVVETSSAVALAALLKNKEKFKGKKVGIVLSGGNVDLAKLPFKWRKYSSIINNLIQYIIETFLMMLRTFINQLKGLHSVSLRHFARKKRIEHLS